MYYKKSNKILQEIKKSKNILINCHESPDADSVGSALSLSYVLKFFSKTVQIICPDKIPDNLFFLKDSEKILKIDIQSFNFSAYDLFICLDSSNLDKAIGSKSAAVSKIKKIVIDHHKTNTKYGFINLIDSKSSACAEVVYGLFQDWGIKLNKQISEALLAGIIGDTGGFKNENTSAKTFQIVSDLIRRGADKNKVLNVLYKSFDIKIIKYVGYVLSKLKFEQRHKFVWVAISNKELKKFKIDKNFAKLPIYFFGNSIKDSDFCILFLEFDKKETKISMRSQNGFDVGDLALRLGGGGHKNASGATIKGVVFQRVVNETLKLASTYSSKFQKFQ